MPEATKNLVDSIHQSSDAARAGISRVEIIEDLGAAEPHWRALERGGSLATPYQQYAWMDAWQRHVGAASGVTPWIVLGYDFSGDPAFLWPLGRTKVGPITCARFLGGKHANFNLALWRRDIAATIDREALLSIIDQVSLAGPDVDALQLFNQPESWDGIANPFAVLPSQPSPSFGYRGVLDRDFEKLLSARMSTAARRKLRNKERSLASHGALRAWRIETREDAERVLDVFFEQKTARMAELGISDVFNEPGVREFITEAATAALPGGRPAIELYALEVGDDILATFGGVTDGHRTSTMFNSITRGPLAPKSPGQMLLVRLVQMCCEQGVSVLDLGVGEAGYKQTFCDEPEPLFDSILGLTPLGRLATHAFRAAYQFKRRVKRMPVVWDTVTAVRRGLRGSKPAAEGSKSAAED